MTKQNSFFNEVLRPVLVLVVICALIGTALALVNHATAPVIAANTEKANNETYFSVLPEADAFTPLDCTVEGVTACLKANNGAGYVVMAQAKGYGGQVPAAVAFDNDGNILRVQMMENSETPGLGTRVREDAFQDQFAGMTAQEKTLDDIDAITGATISSRAALSALNEAIAAYQEVTGGATNG